MAFNIDRYIDSEEFEDQLFLSTLQTRCLPSRTTLVRYLTRGILFPFLVHDPNPETVRALIKVGAAPFHYEDRYEWDFLFGDDIRMHFPHPFRSTLNLSLLIDSESIFNLLINAGERPNIHTHRLIWERRSSAINP